MLAATFIAIFFIPLFYMLLSGRDKKPKPTDTAIEKDPATAPAAS